jgi:hypothetical protein
MKKMSVFATKLSMGKRSTPCKGWSELVRLYKHKNTCGFSLVDLENILFAPLCKWVLIAFEFNEPNIKPC